MGSVKNVFASFGCIKTTAATLVYRSIQSLIHVCKGTLKVMKKRQFSFSYKSGHSPIGEMSYGNFFKISKKENQRVVKFVCEMSIDELFVGKVYVGEML